MTQPLSKARIVAEDLMIPSDTDGIALHLRRKRLASTRDAAAGRIVLMMHGATYPSASLFDVPLGGVSFMDHLATHGYDVYALDARGYGGSTRPPEMEEAPERNPPLVRTEAAVRDLGHAVDYLLERYGVDRLTLVAMSWGGSVAGAYTASHNGKVARLALIAPQWLTEGPAPLDPGGVLGAYRRVAVLDAKARWLSAAPEVERDALIPAGWFETWAEASLATDPEGSAGTPRIMRAPSGAVLDTREYWAAGRAFYEPADIVVPVLLVHAEWDIDVPLDLARGYFARLTGAPYRRWVEIGEGTHLVVLEKNRMQVFDAVTQFLGETYAPAT